MSSEYGLSITQVGQNEYSMSVTIESVYANNVINAGNMITKNIWSGTLAEYEAISEPNENTIYFITTT